MQLNRPNRGNAMNEKFGKNPITVKKREVRIRKNLSKLKLFYQRAKYKMHFINTENSKWYLQDVLREIVENNIKKRQAFARNYFQKKNSKGSYEEN